MTYHPGEIVPESGIYGQFNKNGTKINEVTYVTGERFPPGPEKDNGIFVTV